jgi:hypothetical protein
MAFVATRNATTNAWHAVCRKKEAVWTAFVDPSRTIPIPMRNVYKADATGKTNASSIMDIRAHRRRNACRIIVSMGIVVETSAWALVKRVVRPKKAAASMEYAAISRPERIPTANVRVAEPAMGLAYAARASRNSRMGPYVVRRRNARPDFVPMACVVIAGASERVRHVPQ